MSNVERIKRKSIIATVIWVAIVVIGYLVYQRYFK